MSTPTNKARKTSEAALLSKVIQDHLKTIGELRRKLSNTEAALLTERQHARELLQIAENATRNQAAMARHIGALTAPATNKAVGTNLQICLN